MHESLALEVVTPERRLVGNLAVKSLVVPATSGYLGVLPGHAPIVVNLGVGVVKYRLVDSPNRFSRMAISGGFLEVFEDRATLLAETAELAEDIDVMRARAAKERAEQRLREKAAGTDYARAEVALRRALNRLRAAEEPGGERRH